MLKKLESNGLVSKRGIVMDVETNVGMTPFVYATMGYKVVVVEILPTDSSNLS